MTTDGKASEDAVSARRGHALPFGSLGTLVPVGAVERFVAFRGEALATNPARLARQTRARLVLRAHRAG